MSTAEAAFVGARIVDSLPFSESDGSQAGALASSGIDGVALYLGVASRVCADACLAAGLPIFGVTLADRFDGAAAVASAQALGMAAGTTLFLDVEGQTVYVMPPNDLIAVINAWAAQVASAGFVPGIYIGSPQPLTGDELTHLGVTRYWRAPSRVVDRHGALAEPSAGWCLFQAWPSRSWAGVWVDVDFAYHDYRERSVTWTVA